MAERFWELDFLRGTAVIMMIFFHFFWNLHYFGVTSLEYFGSGPGFLFARSIPVLFLLLVGISLIISFSRIKNKSKKEASSKFFKRGAKIFCYGLIVTIITLLFFPEEFIVFGILHFIGISIILAVPFFNWKWKNLVLGTAIIAIGLYLQNYYVSFPWLLWLGLKPAMFYTFDYFPLLPWFGFVLIGLFLGNVLYPFGKRAFSIREFGKKIFARQFCWLGRHSLAIYFLHQPVLILTILLLRTISQ